MAQQSLSFEYRVRKSTVCNIISETSKAIYECLKEEYLKAPSKKEEWLSISKDFEDIWNLPYCLGAMDGKHVRLQCPKLSGSNYYNYKEFYSIMLLAICDAKYCFILHDTGQFGSNNDSGVLANSGIVEIKLKRISWIYPLLLLTNHARIILYLTFLSGTRSFR